MSNGHTTVAVLSADVLAMTDDLSEEIIHHIQRKVPIPAENILVTATHTHSGPGALGKRFWEQLAAGPFRPGYFDWTARQMADSVISAYERLEPSTLTSYRFNAPDLVANRVIVDGPEDPELQVLVLQSNDGSATTYLVNFAAHPTVLRSRNRLVSGDFPGFLSSALEENEGTVALYTSGALGELKAQPPEGAGVFERAERMGRAMSRRILENRPGGEGKSFVKLSSTKIRIPLPPTHPKISIQRRLPGWIGRFFFDGVTLLQVLRVDDTFLIGIPGDLGSEIGAAWKAKVRQMEKNAFILSFSNDYVGYIMPFYYYNQPTHESAMSFNGPYMADYLGMFVEPLILQ
jgi:neutral ceramidase